MRSHLVFEAVSHIPNRYQLCQLAIKAIRVMHRPHTRIPDTANQVLNSFDTFILVLPLSSSMLSRSVPKDAVPHDAIPFIV